MPATTRLARATASSYASSGSWRSDATSARTPTPGRPAPPGRLRVREPPAPRGLGPRFGWTDLAPRSGSAYDFGGWQVPRAGIHQGGLRMIRVALAAAAVLAALGSVAASARADDACSGGVCSAPSSSREVQSAVDQYLSSARADASLVGGPGSAGYDGGFWIRGGTFLLKINLTIQARWEGFDWDDTDIEPSPGGDLSGFSLPRTTLKFSGDATCDVHYYAELEFGHHGFWFQNENGLQSLTTELWAINNPEVIAGKGPELEQFADYGIAREVWI